MKLKYNYRYESDLLHQECRLLYCKNDKLLITKEVLSKLFKDKYIKNNNVEINDLPNNKSIYKSIYKSILNFFGCY